MVMKFIAVIFSFSVLAGCSTVAGVGKDVQDAAEWSKEKIAQQL
jgi:predicted small secreted protein